MKLSRLNYFAMPCRPLAVNSFFLIAAIVGILTASLQLIHAESPEATTAVETAWKYTFEKPSNEWSQPGFDDSAWEEGFGGFGTRSTPGSRVSTQWSKDDIWLRQTLVLAQVPKKPAIYMHHDEDAEVYINGVQVVAEKGFINEHRVFPIPSDQVSALKQGENLVAVHCHQTTGGQSIDVHVIDADYVPKLPKAKRPTTPYKSALLTKWGQEVTSKNVWTEYPRPQLKREHWQNLNGHWDYAITNLEQSNAPETWNGKLLVPFAIESRLSGVQRLLTENEALWYHRTFHHTPQGMERLKLNFEAVDYRCEAFVNGTSVGKHVGGSNPFSFDISDAVTQGENHLVLRVEDETEGAQIRGKQVRDAHGIWYTQVSGIWQTVWLESVGHRSIEDLTIHTDLADENELGLVKVKVDLSGTSIKGEKIQLEIFDGESSIYKQTHPSDEPFSAEIENPKLWSPDSPHLYRLSVRVLDAYGNVVDQVESYTGVRTVGRAVDLNGHHRFLLNGKPIFHLGPLDQGWWPDGLLTPPSDEGMLFDIEFLKNAGFNMIRKHIKVEPRRYYYHCDRLGMLVWQDQPSGGASPPWTRMAPNPTDADWKNKDADQYMIEIERMIDDLENHPSIVVWVPFNEAWGQHRSVEVGKWTVNRDPSRLVNIASGGNFWPIGDIADHHAYPHPDFPVHDKRFDGYIKVVGEFGGHGYPVEGHLWNADTDNWGYGGLPKTMAEYKDRYAESMRRLGELKKKGIAGGIYTQTTDVEGEINGLMTYDRAVVKISTEELSKIHAPLTSNNK